MFRRVQQTGSHTRLFKGGSVAASCSSAASTMAGSLNACISASVLIGGPVPDSSRQGRQRQRYGESGERLVAGCIPVKFLGCSQCAQSAQVCMITTTSGKGLVFPKGGWEDDESVESAAQRETVEEAGVRGVLEEPLLGVFCFASGKHSHDAAGSTSSTPTAGRAGSVSVGVSVSVSDNRGAAASATAAAASAIAWGSVPTVPPVAAAAENGVSSSGSLSAGLGGSGSGSGGGGACKAFIYVMHVAEELPTWPESKDRQRVWCSIAEASRQCKHQWMRDALAAWVRRKGWEEVLGMEGCGAASGSSSAGAQQQQQLLLVPAAAAQPL